MRRPSSTCLSFPAERSEGKGIHVWSRASHGSPSLARTRKRSRSPGMTLDGALAPVVEGRRRHERMVAGKHRLVRPGPEEARMAVVEAPDFYLGRIETGHHAAIDAEDDRRIFLRRHEVGDKTANLAAVHGDIVVLPGIGLSGIRIRRLQQLGLPLGPAKIGPETAIAAADGAVAIEYPYRQLGDLEADGGAVAGGADHQGLRQFDKPKSSATLSWQIQLRSCSNRNF